MAELLTLREICHMLKVSKRTIFRWIKAGEFPRPVVKTFGTYRWRADDINKFVTIGDKR